LFTGCAVLFACGPADEPASGAEGVTVSPNVVVTVDTNGRDMDDLTGFDGDRLDPGTISTPDWVTEGEDIIVFSDLFVTGGSGEHAETIIDDDQYNSHLNNGQRYSLFLADGIE
jgi:hypothetical protein